MPHKYQSATNEKDFVHINTFGRSAGIFLRDALEVVRAKKQPGRGRLSLYTRYLQAARDFDAFALWVTGAQRITHVREGELIDIDGAQVATLPPCGESEGHWRCVTCNESFANQFQKDTHIQWGVHRLVWVCHTHGYEVP